MVSMHEEFENLDIIENHEILRYNNLNNILLHRGITLFSFYFTGKELNKLYMSYFI